MDWEFWSTINHLMAILFMGIATFIEIWDDTTPWMIIVWAILFELSAIRVELIRRNSS